MNMTKIISLSNQKGGVGKTTTCVNLAACLAEREQRVLVVDVDPQGNATSGLGLQRKEGDSIYDALLDQSDLKPFIKETQVPNLHLMASGQIPPDPAELLSSDRTARVFANLRGTYDMIVVDSPPVLPVTDAIVLTQQPQVSFSQGMVLTLTKHANKNQAVVGDIVTYTIEVRNNGAAAVVPAWIDDHIPTGFKYVQGSTQINGAPSADPGGNRTLSFDLGAVPALVDGNGNARLIPASRVMLSFVTS